VTIFALLRLLFGRGFNQHPLSQPHQASAPSPTNYQSAAQ
jgi:hypothetical protein